MAIPASNRSGTVLILVSCICALMASLSLAFLTRMRGDGEESLAMMREAQAHIMLSAACAYIQEASRLGYDGAGTDPYHYEAFGWIDVRDGMAGPKATHERSDVDPKTSPITTTADAFLKSNDARFPMMTARRFPMYVKAIPPFAIRLDAAPNPIDSKTGIPYMTRPDPMPVRAPADWANPTAQEFADFERGDPTPRANSIGLSWYRLYRLGSVSDARFSRYNAATFIVTCGAGGSLGYRTWQEVALDNQKDVFANDQSFFDAIRASETRLWYLVEWSPAVGGEIMFNLIHHRPPTWDADDEQIAITQYGQFPSNFSRYTHSQTRIKNFGGTIRMVQRLVEEPPEW